MEFTFRHVVQTFRNIYGTKYLQTKNKGFIIKTNTLLIVLYLSAIERILCQFCSLLWRCWKMLNLKPILLSQDAVQYWVLTKICRAWHLLAVWQVTGLKTLFPVFSWTEATRQNMYIYVCVYTYIFFFLWHSVSPEETKLWSRTRCLSPSNLVDLSSYFVHYYYVPQHKIMQLLKLFVLQEETCYVLWCIY